MLFYTTAMDQFLDESIATCTASDGTVFLSPSSGVPPGLSCSTNMFVEIYGKASEEYENNIKLDTKMVMASSLNDDNQMVSTSSTTFVDDMCTTIASRENTQLPSMIQKVDVEIEKQWVLGEWSSTKKKWAYLHPHMAQILRRSSKSYKKTKMLIPKQGT